MHDRATKFRGRRWQSFGSIAALGAMVLFAAACSDAASSEDPAAAADLSGGFLDADIGAVAFSGGSSYTSGVYGVSGSGSDIWGNADAFHFTYASLSGDGQIVARVTSIQNTSSWAKAGVMIRETLTPGSKHAMVILSPSHGVAMQDRATTGGSMSGITGPNVVAPEWVKLARSGSTLTGYASRDGASWTTVGSVQISMATSVFIGLAVTSHNNGSLCTAKMDHVSGTGLSTGGSDAGAGTDAGVSPDANPITPDAAPSSNFVSVCGTQLCLGGAPFVVHGATAYGQYGTPSSVVSLAQSGKLNLAEIVEFETQYHTLSDTMSSATWTRVDQFIAAMSAAKVHVLLNLSSYGQSLAVAGQTPTAVDWGPYLSFVANRVNTVTGVRYADDPTIAMIELWGEIPPPDGTGTNGTPQQMTDFFHRSLQELASLDPKHLHSTGGFSYLNETNAAGIDWKTIMSDPNDHVCAVEINSWGDRNTTIPMVSQYCKGLGKPWFLSAWSSCINKPSAGSWDIDDYPSDSTAAQHAQDMYNVAYDNAPNAPVPAMPGIGSDFWNLGPANPFDPSHPGTCQLNPTYDPLTWAVVQSGAR